MMKHGDSVLHGLSEHLRLTMMLAAQANRRWPRDGTKRPALARRQPKRPAMARRVDLPWPLVAVSMACTTSGQGACRISAGLKTKKKGMK